MIAGAKRYSKTARAYIGMEPYTALLRLLMFMCTLLRYYSSNQLSKIVGDVTLIR